MGPNPFLSHSDSESLFILSNPQEILCVIAQLQTLKSMRLRKILVFSGSNKITETSSGYEVTKMGWVPFLEEVLA